MFAFVIVLIGIERLRSMVCMFVCLSVCHLRLRVCVWIIIIIILLSRIRFSLEVETNVCLCECTHDLDHSTFSTMAEESSSRKKRCVNFTPQEFHVLVDEVEANKHILFSAFKDACTAATKQMKWTTIAEKMNLVGGADTTPDEIRRKWTTYQSTIKRKAGEERKSARKTGGGTSLDKNKTVTDDETRVLAIIGPTAIHGVEGGIDTLNVPSIGGDDNADVPSTLSTSAHPSSKGVDPTSGQSVASSSEMSAGPSFKRVNLSHPKAPRKAPFSEKLLQVERDKLGVMREMLSVQKQHLEVRLCFIHFRRYLIPDQFWNVFKRYLSKYLFIYFVLFTQK